MIGKFVAVLGFLLTTIGVFMPFWVIGDYVHFGVFMSCYWTFKQCESTQNFDDMYKGANLADLLWALSLSGISALLLSLVGICSYPVHITVDYCKVTIAILVSMLLGVGVALILAAAIVIGDFYVLAGADVGHLVNAFGWAWYLTIAGLVILVVSLICFIFHICSMINDNRVMPASNQTSCDTRQDGNRRSDFIGQEPSWRSIRHPYVNKTVYDEEIFDKQNRRLF